MPAALVKPHFAKGKIAFQAMEWADDPSMDWGDASLIQVVRYLRGSKYLELPEEWRSCFPAQLALPANR